MDITQDGSDELLISDKNASNRNNSIISKIQKSLSIDEILKNDPTLMAEINVKRARKEKVTEIELSKRQEKQTQQQDDRDMEVGE